MGQLSLVFFSTLAQSTVGLFLIVATLLMLDKDGKRQQPLTMLLLPVLVLLSVAGAAAGSHLGQPLRAPNVAFGLLHLSALSVEILVTTLFGGAVFTYGAMSHFKLFPKLQKLVLAGGMFMGVALLLAIANVYTLATVPAWNSLWTPFQYSITALIVGAPLAAFVMRAYSKVMVGYDVEVERVLRIIAGALLVVMLIAYPLYLFWLSGLNMPAELVGRFDYSYALLAARFVLLIAGLGLFAFAAPRFNSKPLVFNGVCVALVLLSELCGRIFFYDLHMFASGM